MRATRKTTTTTLSRAAGIPRLPSPLPRVADPGTIDPLLGEFPVELPRSIQYAWVSLAGRGRTFTAFLRALDERFRSTKESDLYLDGVFACTALRKNNAVGNVADTFGESYSSAESPLTDKEVRDVGLAIVVAAVANLCGDMGFLTDDPNLLAPTPVAIRAILGVSDRRLSDANANRFANYVCTQLDRGTTQSRLTSNIADGFKYPDDLAEELVSYIEEFVCR